MSLWEVLAAMASIAASLVGFSGLLTAFRASSEALTPYDINNIRTLLIYSVSALVFALLPLPLAATRGAAAWWPGLTAMLAVTLLFWSVRSPVWMKKKGLRPRLPILYIGVIAVQALLGAVLIAGAGWSDHASAFYVIGVLWLLIVAILVFVVQIFLLLPIEPPQAGE